MRFSRLGLSQTKMIFSNFNKFLSGRVTLNCNYVCRNYAKKDTGSVSMLGGALKKKKLGKLGPVMEKKVLPVETDPEKLTRFVCGSNIFKTGEDVKLKDTSEYPEWLWNVRLGPPPKLEEYEPDSKQYWKRVRKLGIKHQGELLKLRKV